MQVEVHPHWRNQRSIEYGRGKGMHTVAYAPLSSPTTMATMKRHVPNLLKVRLPLGTLLLLLHEEHAEPNHGMQQCLSSQT